MRYRDDREAQRQRAQQLSDELKVVEEHLSAHEAKDAQDEKQIADLKAEVARLKKEAGEAEEPQNKQQQQQQQQQTKKKEKKKKKKRGAKERKKHQEQDTHEALSRAARSHRPVWFRGLQIVAVLAGLVIVTIQSYDERSRSKQKDADSDGSGLSAASDPLEPAPAPDGWTSQSLGAKEREVSRLWDVFFLNASHGWAAGGFDLLVTTDGGVRWKTLNQKMNLVKAVWFIDEKLGFAAGNGISTTTDGGHSWRRLPQDGSLWGIHFYDDKNGWVVGEGSLLHQTHDGGKTWHTMKLKGLKHNALGVHFVSPLQGWVVGGASMSGGGTKILSTSDGGKTWSPHNDEEVDALDFYLTDVFFMDDKLGWAVGANGAIVATTNGGRTWQVQRNHGKRLSDVHFVDAKRGFAVGQQQLIRTSDGGATWIDVPVDPSTRLNGVSFVSKTKGWLVGERLGHRGVIFKTTSGGTP